MVGIEVGSASCDDTHSHATVAKHKARLFAGCYHARVPAYHAFGDLSLLIGSLEFLFSLFISCAHWLQKIGTLDSRAGRE